MKLKLLCVWEEKLRGKIWKIASAVRAVMESIWYFGESRWTQTTTKPLTLSQVVK